MRYFEDIQVDEQALFGRCTLTAEMITSFALEYDPLPFHLDASGGERSMFKGQVASGLQTLCVATRLLAEGFLRDTSMAGGAGIDRLRWTRPVRPGDAVSVSVRVCEKMPHPTLPRVGVVRAAVTVLAGSVGRRDEPCCTLTVDYLFGMRP